MYKSPNNIFKSVLVVDDNGINRLLPGLILRPFGWDVYESGSGQDALKILESTAVSFMLLDISMPEMSGLDVLKNIKKNLRFNKLRIVAYTSLDRTSDVSRLTEFGFDAVLIKPLTSIKLLEILKDD